MTQYVNDQLCSHVWLNPIKTVGDGVQKIGIEMEMHAYDSQTLAPIGTHHAKVTPQILMQRIRENVSGAKEKIDKKSGFITLVDLPEGGNFSLEPGGQIEFSSMPCATLSQLAKETAKNLLILEQAARGEVVFLSHGTNPVADANHPLLLPKERYKIMTRYFESAPKTVRGIDMMRHCATVQANLDVFGDTHWRDAVQLNMVLVPLTQYLFANSLYFKGQKSTYLSERQAVWNAMDPSRSGFPFINHRNYFSECPECAYANWGKKAGVFLVESLPLEEQPLFGELTFSQWMNEGYKGTKPTVDDWETHLATLFPHLRLRKFLEVRHIDAQPFEHTFAPIAFFAALIQCNKTRQKTWEILKPYHFDYEKLFSGEVETYSFLHEPLLNLACEILTDCKEIEGARAVEAYKVFIQKKEEYFAADSAQDFLIKHKTATPSGEFLKYLTI
ncbi:MAG: glutamate-cysteine ligase family protein [Bdellovibrionota bacterium]